MNSLDLGYLRDEIHLETGVKDRQPILVYMIAGNPGLIEYYRGFLKIIFENLRQHHKTSNVHVYGHSLPGFTLHTPFEDDNTPPYSLDEEIRLIEQNLLSTIQQVSQDRRHGSVRPVRVILIGHSVGAYMLLEILRHWHNGDFTNDHTFDLSAGVCLFPTIVEIAQSPRGRLISPVLCSPGFTWYCPMIIKLILAIIPIVFLIWVVENILGMPMHAAKTTVAYLKSSWGVRQTMYMAKFEMLQLTQDRWPDAMWTRQAGSVAKKERIKHSDLLFYWGKRDHWVNDITRDALIERRAAGDTAQCDQPVMEIDTHGVPHAFSLTHSEVIALRVSRFVSDKISDLKL